MKIALCQMQIAWEDKEKSGFVTFSRDDAYWFFNEY